MPRSLLAELGRIAAEMTRARDPGELVAVVQGVLDQLASFEQSSLYLREPGTGRLRLYHTRNFTPEDAELAEATAAERHPGWVFRTAQPIRVDDTDVQSHPAVRDYRPEMHMRSHLCLPVMAQDECVGVFGLASQMPRAFTDWDQDVLQFVCNQAGATYLRLEEAEALANAEKELRAQATEIEAAHRMASLKDEFLAMMSHELRTPLNAILGLTESLREGTYGALVARQEKALGLVDASGRHLLVLIGEILDFAKSEAGKLQLDMTQVDISAIAGECGRMLGAQARSQDIELTVIDEAAPPRVPGDERRLRQIILNLLGNAVKFTERGGRVGVRVARGPEPDEVCVEVWDTGIGISEEDQSRLFQPFVQLDARLARRYEGTGLGLVLVARLVALHGGRVQVKSKLGEGSTFTVVLPAK